MVKIRTRLPQIMADTDAKLLTRGGKRDTGCNRFDNSPFTTIIGRLLPTSSLSSRLDCRAMLAGLSMRAEKKSELFATCLAAWRIIRLATKG
jgi:hypothetical protein